MKKSLTLESPARKHLGAGFLLTHGLVLTAAHCLANHKESEVHVVVHLAPGEELRFTGRAKVDDDLDVAAVEIDNPDLHLKSFLVECVPSVLEDAVWRLLSLNPEYSGLKGTVQDPQKWRKMSSGTIIESLELLVERRTISFKGYSGGPVEVPYGSTPPSWRVAGMLLEELREGRGSDRASNVLYAATLRTISDSRVLGNSILDVLDLEPEHRSESPADVSNTNERQDDTQIVLKRLKLWAGAGSDSPQVEEELTELAESIVSDLLTGGNADAD